MARLLAWLPGRDGRHLRLGSERLAVRIRCGFFDSWPFIVDVHVLVRPAVLRPPNLTANLTNQQMGMGSLLPSCSKG